MSCSSSTVPSFTVVLCISSSYIEKFFNTCISASSKSIYSKLPCSISVVIVSEEEYGFISTFCKGCFIVSTCVFENIYVIVNWSNPFSLVVNVSFSFNKFIFKVPFEYSYVPDV